MTDRTRLARGAQRRRRVAAAPTGRAGVRRGAVAARRFRAAVLLGSAGAAGRTLRSWAAARSRRRRKGLWNDLRRRVRVRGAAQPAAHRAAATFAVAPAALVRAAAGPSPEAGRHRRAAVRRKRAAVRRTARLAVVRRNLAAGQRWRRTDSVLRVSRLDSEAAQRARSPAAAEQDPKPPVPARVAPLEVAAGSHPIARAEAAAAAARTVAAAAAARPIDLVLARRAVQPPEGAVHSAERALADWAPAPPRLALLLPEGLRKTGKTCWWAGWLRHTACRRS